MVVTDRYAHYVFFGEDPPPHPPHWKKHFWYLPADWAGSCHLAQIVHPYSIFNSSSFCQCLATTLQTTGFSLPPSLLTLTAQSLGHLIASSFSRIWGPLCTEGTQNSVATCSWGERQQWESNLERLNVHKTMVRPWMTIELWPTRSTVASPASQDLCSHGPEQPELSQWLPASPSLLLIVCQRPVMVLTQLLQQALSR